MSISLLCIWFVIQQAPPPPPRALASHPEAAQFGSPSLTLMRENISLTDGCVPHAKAGLASAGVRVMVFHHLSWSH